MTQQPKDTQSIHQAGALCSNPGLLDPQMEAPNSREGPAKGKVSSPQGWESQQLIRGVGGAQRLESSAFLLGGVATVLTASGNHPHHLPVQLPWRGRREWGGRYLSHHPQSQKLWAGGLAGACGLLASPLGARIPPGKSG